LRGLNASLPRDVAIVAAADAALGFDPRRAARGKHYRYTWWNHEVRSPLHERTSWHVRAPLDTGAMAAAGRVLIGEHDFSAFRAADCERVNTVRLMRRVDVTRDGPCVALDVEATAFLKHMVRVIAGTLCAVGRGDLTPEGVARILSSRDRTLAGTTAPGARGAG
jgi:tRNA pseudouridine38-40 synthase